MLAGLWGCKNNKKEDFVFEEFSSQVENIGMKIDSVDDTGLIYIKQGELTLKVSLDNLRRDFARDQDKSIINDFVNTLISYSIELPTTWVEAKDDIYMSLFPNDYDFKDFIHEKVTDEISKICVHSGNDKYSWITKEDIGKWNISESELDKQASINADKLLAITEIKYDTIDNRKLGLINVDHATLKAALLFAPTMKDKIEEVIGFPFYAVIPVRDFCYIFSENDFDFFSKRIGSIVVNEYKNSGYPITTELLKFSNDGIEAVGKYPVE